MKKLITTITLAIIAVSLSFAGVQEPDKMYVHLKGANGADSVVMFTLADVDSIVYYAPAIPELPQSIDWNNVSEGVAQANALTDADGNSYSAVKIGEQIWMAENLAVSHTLVTSGVNGDNGGTCGYTDAYVWSNTDAKYGKLYSYQAALSACPTGWHLPSDAEWTSLTDYLATDHSGTEGTALKATSGWSSGGNGNDAYGFTALPGGYCYSDGALGGQGLYGYWWSATPSGSNNAYYRSLHYNTATVYRNSSTRDFGFSARCVRDVAATQPTLTTTAATAITATTTTLGGEVTANGGADITACGVEYSTTENFTEGNGTQVAYATPATGTFTIDLTGLTASTTYYYKAYATNSEGSSYGSELNFTTSAAGPDYTQASGTFTDARDATEYNWVKIGEQIWMAENLKASQYADGTPIDNVTDNTAWANLGDNDTDKAYCAYNNDANNESDTYGYLYTYAAATNGDNSGSAVQGVCPTGWHLPSDAEWDDLKYSLSGDNKGSQLGGNPALWNDGSLENATGFGTSGFTALPGGGRNWSDGTWENAGGNGNWWGHIPGTFSLAFYCSLRYDFSTFNTTFGNKSHGFSVRCVRD